MSQSPSSSDSMAGVPTQMEAAGLLPFFDYRDAAGNMQVYNTGPVPLVRKITEYHVEPTKWTNLPEDQRTVDGILSYNVGNHLCGICGAAGMNCPGQACTDFFRTRISAYGDRVIEIREAGVLGKGTFATEDIPAGAWLGEYLGEIAPDESVLTLDQSAYTFAVSRRYCVESRQFRNWTAFMNHHCDENVEVVDYVYGRRHVLAFRSKRAIAKDEQVFTWYGPDYFTGRGIVCLCDAVEGGHVPNPATAAANKKKTAQNANKSADDSAEGGNTANSATASNNKAKNAKKSAARATPPEIRFSLGKSARKTSRGITKSKSSRAKEKGSRAPRQVILRFNVFD